MFKLYFMPRCPFAIDSLFCDEAMAPAFCVLVDLVHPALIDPVLLIVVVRYDAVIGPTVGGEKIPHTEEHYIRIKNMFG